MFTTEKEMMWTFRSHSQDFLARVCPKKSESPMFILEEFDSYTGIPDLVIGTFCSSIDRDRSVISKDWVLPLIGLSIGDVIQIQGFSEAYGVSAKTAKSILQSYVEAGFAEKLEKSEYVVVKPYDIFAKSIVSIEGKLKNWKRALLQAQRYRRFSNLSFVLLEKKHSRPALANIHLFQASNIGLVTMDGDDFCIINMPIWSEYKINTYTARLVEAAYSSIVSDSTIY